MSNHPITPPPKLVEDWFFIWECSDDEETSFAQFVIPLAAQWGADQELAACCDWVDWHWAGTKSRQLRATRRPKTLSIKQQALEAARIELFKGGKNAALIIQALEALPDD